jgi:hypothetical protein
MGSELTPWLRFFEEKLGILKREARRASGTFSALNPRPSSCCILCHIANWKTFFWNDDELASRKGECPDSNQSCLQLTMPRSANQSEQISRSFSFSL